MLTFPFSVIHYSREQRLISFLLSLQKCGHALFRPSERSQMKRCCRIRIRQKRHISACMAAFVLLRWQEAQGVVKALKAAPRSAASDAHLWRSAPRF